MGLLGYRGSKYQFPSQNTDGSFVPHRRVGERKSRIVYYDMESVVLFHVVDDTIDYDEAEADLPASDSEPRYRLQFLERHRDKVAQKHPHCFYYTERIPRQGFRLSCFSFPVPYNLLLLQYWYPCTTIKLSKSFAVSLNPFGYEMRSLSCHPNHFIQSHLFPGEEEVFSSNIKFLLSNPSEIS